MNEAALTLAFAAGTLAAVNPCGFALLPAYLALFVSGPEPAGPRVGTGGAQGARVTRALGPLRRAGLATAAMTGGFVLVFGTFALLVTPFALSVERWLPWVTIVIGLALLGLGAWLLTGREIKLAVPRLGARGDPTSSVWAMGGYGVSFAVASLSCTVAPFLAVTTTAFRNDSLPGVIGVFVAYALGMGAVVGALTLAAAFSRQALVHRLRAALPYVTRASGGLLILAGAYAAYYGWYEVRVLRGEQVEDPIIDTAVAWQSEISRGIAGLTAAEIAVAVVGLGLALWGTGRLARVRAARRAAPTRQLVDVDDEPHIGAG